MTQIDFRRSPAARKCMLASFGIAAILIGFAFTAPPSHTALSMAGGPARPGRLAAVGLDHVPIAVRDLKSSQRKWREALGFTIKPGRLHENTIENAHIKFGDGSALELIAATRPADALAESYLAFLEKGEGGAFLALAPANFANLEDAVSRTGFRHDVVVGPYYRWLTFPPDQSLDYLFFSHTDGAAADGPDVLRHRNGALGLAAVWIPGPRAARTRELLETLGLQSDGATVDLPNGVVADRLLLDAGELYLGRHLEGTGPPITGVTILVRSVDGARVALRIDNAVIVNGSDERGSFVRVPPDLANGIWLEFLESARLASRSPALTTRDNTEEEDI